ncbi:MAG: branched-chain amino acid ABC transporter substrate-binding protein [Leptolyngbyaceae bacterium]|nr:branched-chain amino acid ABC transporter substrate-binding protein [Leptolyngbyaceae bacterium]
MLLPACQTVTALPDCQDPLGCVVIGPEDPIKIAALQALTGDSAPLGQDQVNTIKLLLSERQWLLLGRKIELQVEDSRCTPEGGANAALKVVADPQMIAILGTTCSGAAATASEIMSDAGLVMISSSNTTPALTTFNGQVGENGHPGFFRVIYNDAIAGQTAAEFAHKILGVSAAATLNDGDLYSIQLTEVFAQSFEALGGKIVLEASPNTDTEDMTPFLEAIANAEAEFVFMPMTKSPAAQFINQAKEFPRFTKIGPPSLSILVGEELITDSFIESVAENGIGTYFAGPTPIKNNKNQALIEDYEKTYNASPQSIYYSFAHDAIRLLLLAIVKTAEQHQDGTLVIGRQALRDALYGIKSFEGITGNLSCNEFGDCGVTNFSIVQLVNPDGGVNDLKQNIVYTYDP